MVVKFDAEEVEYFALVPVGCAPDGEHGVDRRSFSGDPALQAEALVFGDAGARHRVQVVNHLEARLHRIPVDAGDGGQADEAVLILQEGSDFDDTGGVDLERELVEREFAVDDSTRQGRFEGLGHTHLFDLISQHFAISLSQTQWAAPVGILWVCEAEIRSASASEMPAISGPFDQSSTPFFQM
jgi:hypothetical protein